MSAPGLGKEPRISLPDFWSWVNSLPKPLKAIVYLIMLAALTVAAMGALLATMVIIGEVTGAFDLGRIIGH